ncbi:MAG: hypothetical protein IH840_01680 [Candidatus Heimdallarchaeota archaeon]|nr:hypothetical protein [Candidatus Heimdallarchaeota archaeon]
MAERSIQVRRVSERVKSYFVTNGMIYNVSNHTNRTIIKGKRRLGSDEVECIVAETSRGTSVGFYLINTIQNFVYAIPFVILLFLHILAENSTIKNTLTTNNVFDINFLKLLTGDGQLSIMFVIALIIVGFLPVVVEYYIQNIRLNNLKANFSFYSKGGIWESREISPNVVILQAVRSVISHAYVLAILYFLIFSTTGEALGELLSHYNTSEEELKIGVIDAFSLTIGLIIGLISTDKVLSLRAESAKYDKRNRFSGSFLERRMEPYIFAGLASLVTSLIFTFFMSQTFLIDATIQHSIQIPLYAVIGSIIATIIYDEGNIWLAAVYAILIFFASLIFVFRTGNQPEYAYIVVFHLFLLPIPFLIFLSKELEQLLKRYDIVNYEWYYDLIPILAMYSILKRRKERKRTIIEYEKQLEEEIDFSIDDQKLQLNRDILQDCDSYAYRLARHYFELLLTYTASYEENVLVLIPTSNQLESWWSLKTKLKSKKGQREALNYVDNLLWNTEFVPQDELSQNYELLCKEMVLAIK